MNIAKHYQEPVFFLVAVMWI